jgi:hypothetical protein
MTDDGTESGTALDKMMTADVELAIVIYTLDGRFATTEAGTTTAELEAHELGITTVAGTKTNEETATADVAEAGSETAVEVADAGTLVKSTIAKLGDDDLTMIYELASDETTESGTITGDDQVETMNTGDENHESGTAVT